MKYFFTIARGGNSYHEILKVLFHDFEKECPNAAFIHSHSITKHKGDVALTVFYTEGTTLEVTEQYTEEKQS